MRGALLLALLAGAANASERFDHRGAVGLLLSGGVEQRTQLGLLASEDSGWRGLALVGGTLAIGVDGNELFAQLRAGFGGPIVLSSIDLGYRGYYGYDQLKTFVDLGVFAQATPGFLLGPRVGVGLQWDFSPVAGAFVSGGVRFGFGAQVLFSGEVLAGIQLRSYLLER